jgi:hypothetical protein
VEVSVDGLALLLSTSSSVRVGDVWRIQINEQTIQAAVAHTEPQGMFLRVGVTYVSPPRPPEEAAVQ